MKDVALIFSRPYAEALSQLPVHRQRECMTFSLIQHTGLLSKLHVIAPTPATKTDMERFHSSRYIDALKIAETTLSSEDKVEYGLVDDASVFPGLFSYCQQVAGASLTAASLLATGRVTTAINWGGGRHHAKKDQASGFCYVNDIVLAVDRLLQAAPASKVLVVDIDVHHGDGVEEAFYYSSRVCTISFHKYARGFFPGTGAPSRIGQGGGRYKNINVPLDDGISDEQFLEVFEAVFQAATDAFAPTFLVIVCGVDTLSRLLIVYNMYSTIL